MEYSGRTNTVDKETGKKIRDVAKERANDGKISVLLLNTAAGGVGLNLQGNKSLGTGPTAMYLLNEPWRDVDTRQVIDRISRQGQQNDTTSWIGRTRGTIEERVHELVAAKGMVGSFLSHGEEGTAYDMMDRLQRRMTLQDQFKLLNLSPELKAKLTHMADQEKINRNKARVSDKPATATRTTRTTKKVNPWD